MKLQDKLAGQIPGLRNEIKDLSKTYGKTAVSQVTIEQVIGGMRGVRGLICDTSLVEADTGLIIRGIPIKNLTEKTPEEVFYLMLTGELPDKEGLASLKEDLKKRAAVPEYVWKVLKAMPADSHPMTMLSAAILVLQHDSAYAKKYAQGMRKEDYWVYTLEDALSLIGKLPSICAGIYRMRFNKGPGIPSDSKLDWGADYAHMMGLPDPNGEFTKLMKLYLVLHCDHEGGNVSAFTGATVSSALSDLYYSISAAMDGLAGPLHGLANQECLRWVLDVKEKFHGVPTREQLKQFAWETLNSGKVVPGYGHAVLRVTDPRYEAFLDFGKKYCGNDPIFQIVAEVFETVPEVLKQVQKIKDPWPNVDAGSGSLLWHYGLTEFDYYTVLFGLSRALGISAQAILARALGLPITRPKSVTTAWLRQQAAKTLQPAAVK